MSFAPRNADTTQVSPYIDDDTTSLLHKFWEDEKINQLLPLKNEDKPCKQHSVSTHFCMPDDIFMMRLSFKTDSPKDIGDSLPIANTLHARKKSRLRSRPEISKQHNELLREYREPKLYDDFLHEYCELNHEELVTKKWVSLFKTVCNQHSAIIRDASIAKLRIVFGVSSKTRDGTSLGDHLLVGPKLQQDLPLTTIRWRQWQCVYVADIAERFRQILIDPAITKKVAAEARQLTVLDLDCVSKKLSYRYSNRTRLVRITSASILGKLETTEAFPSGNYCYKI